MSGFGGGERSVQWDALTPPHPTPPHHTTTTPLLTGRIDDIDVGVTPRGEGGGRLNSDPFLTLQFHRVHFRTDAILPADVVDFLDTAGVEEDPLRQCGLARVDMSRDADIPEFAQSELCTGEIMGGQSLEGSGQERGMGRQHDHSTHTQQQQHLPSPPLPR